MLSIQFNALGKSAQAVAIFAVTVIVAVGSSARETNSRSGASSASPSLPLSFEPNQGQSKNGVLFVARGPGYVLYLNEQGSSFQFSSGIGMSDSPTPLFGISLAGAKKSEKSKTNMLGMDEQPSKSSYYTGSDPKKWFTGIPNFSRVERRGVYEGIDATYRGSQGELECEFKVAPQANPGTIALEIVGVQGLRREAQGDIVFTIANVEMRLHRPAAYQETDGSTQSAVTSRYVLTGNIVTLRLGPYDRRKPLFINPVLSYSGLLKLQGANSLPGALSLPQELFFNKPTPCFELRTPALWPSTSLRSNDLQPNTYRSNMPFRTLANSVLSLAILMTAATLPCAAQGKTGATVVATIPADAFPVAVAVNPRTRKAYIANNTGGDVTIIDERTNASKTIADIGGSFANAIAVNTVTNKIYVANTESGNVLVIDGATNHRTEVSDPNGGFPLSIAVDPGLNKIYVGNYTTNNVTVIDGRTNATTTVADPNAQGPRCVAVNPVTHKVYLGNDITGNITIIDGLTNTVSTAGDPNAFVV